MTDVSGDPSGPALPATWARLNPLSPVIKGSRAVLALGVVVAPRGLGPGGFHASVVEIVVALAVSMAVIAAGVVSWVVTRWRVSDGELQLETGLIRRQSIRVPLSRVQAVDVVRPLAAQLLGLSELRLVLAGGGTGKARLSFLTQERAVQVRAQLLAAGSEVHENAPVAPEWLLAAVPNGRLVASALLGAPAIILALLVPVLVVLAVVEPASVGPSLGAMATTILALGTTVLHRLNVELNFTVAESADGLHLRSGLLQTRAETIPAGRVQAVRLVEPLLWRPLGWCRLEVDVAQQREREAGEQNARQLTRALLPVGDRHQADSLLFRVFPGATTRPPTGSMAPKRAWLKAPLSYPRLASWYDERHVVARTGRLKVESVVVPLAKVQSIRWTQGPVQRRLRLATVHVDTAGRHWKAAARDRDLTESQELLTELPARARIARAVP